MGWSLRSKRGGGGDDWSDNNVTLNEHGRHELAEHAVPCAPFQGTVGVVIVVTVAVGTLVLYFARYFMERRHGIEKRTLKIFTMDVAKLTFGASVAWLVLLIISRIASVATSEADLNDPVGTSTGVRTSAAFADASAAWQYLHPRRLEPIAWYPPALILESTLGSLVGVALAKLLERLCQRSLRAAQVDEEVDVALQQQQSEVELFGEPSRSFWSPWTRTTSAAAAPRRTVATKVKSPGSETSTTGGYSSPLDAPHQSGAGVGARVCSSMTWLFLGFARANAHTGQYSPRQRMPRRALSRSFSFKRPTSAVDLAHDPGAFGYSSRAAVEADDAALAAAIEEAEEADRNARWSWFAAQLLSWGSCVAVSRLVSAALLLAFIRVCPPHLSPVVAMAQWVQALPLTCGAKQILCFGVFRLLVDVVVLAVTDELTKHRGSSNSGGNARGSEPHRRSSLLLLSVSADGLRSGRNTSETTAAAATAV